MAGTYTVIEGSTAEVAAVEKVSDERSTGSAGGAAAPVKQLAHWEHFPCDSPLSLGFEV